MTLSTAVWFPVLTLLLGYAAKSLTDWLQDRRHAERERIARLEARHDQIFLRRADFQRETLLELQTAMADLMRKTALVNFEYTKAFTSTGGDWGRHPIPNDLAESLRGTRASVHLLGVRVLDRAVIEMVEQMKTISVECTIASSERVSTESLMKLGDLYDRINTRIGEVLRELDEIEDKALFVSASQRI